ncbi:MAG: hypothetical protein QXM93_07370 [Candidatus Methanomethyliaceae archaeon]
MSEEKELKKEGENLARLAVERGLAAKQLQMIYKVIRTKPLPFAEAFVQRQLSRALEGTMQGAEVLEKILEMLKRYENDKLVIERIIMYAVMLYPYYERAPLLKMMRYAEPVVREILKRNGLSLDRVEPQLHGNTVILNVHIPNFRDNPKILAGEIERGLRSEENLSGVSLRVWIKSR